MAKTRLSLAFAAIACLLVVSAAPAMAKEFKPVGHAITSHGGEATFTVTGGSVTCLENKDKGKVTSATETADEVTYEKCKSSLGTEATVETCKYIFLSNETSKLVGGCKVTSSICVITPSTTENNELKGFTFTVLKEAELESELKANVEKEITYSVSGACGLVGIKAGKKVGSYKGADTLKGVIFN